MVFHLLYSKGPNSWQEAHPKLLELSLSQLFDLPLSLCGQLWRACKEDPLALRIVKSGEQRCDPLPPKQRIILMWDNCQEHTVSSKLRLQAVSHACSLATVEWQSKVMPLPGTATVEMYKVRRSLGVACVFVISKAPAAIKWLTQAQGKDGLRCSHRSDQPVSCLLRALLLQDVRFNCESMHVRTRHCGCTSSPGVPKLASAVMLPFHVIPFISTPWLVPVLVVALQSLVEITVVRCCSDASCRQDELFRV